MLSTALKELAVELNVCVFTSTQVNANADSNNGIKNEPYLIRKVTDMNGNILYEHENNPLQVLDEDYVFTLDSFIDFNNKHYFVAPTGYLKNAKNDEKILEKGGIIL